MLGLPSQNHAEVAASGLQRASNANACSAFLRRPQLLFPSHEARDLYRDARPTTFRSISRVHLGANRVAAARDEEPTETGGSFHGCPVRRNCGRVDVDCVRRLAHQTADFVAVAQLLDEKNVAYDCTMNR